LVTEPVSKTDELRPCEFDPRPLRFGMANGRGADSGLNPEGRMRAGGRDLRHLLATAQPVKGPL
jgi:hypothetical protein